MIVKSLGTFASSTPRLPTLHLTAAGAAPGPEVGGFESPRALRSVYTDGVIRALRSDPEMETVRNNGIMRSRAVNVIFCKSFHNILKAPLLFGIAN